MKCRRCKAPALIDVRRHNAAFCADCFVRHCQEQVRRAIDGFDMIQPGERVLDRRVGRARTRSAPGSSSSTSATRPTGSTSASASATTPTPPAATPATSPPTRGLKLLEIDIPDEYGFDIETAAATVRRPPCGACGLSKRHLFNQAALDGGYDVVATGHNLDDEAAVLFGNVLRWDAEYLGRQYPVLPAAPGFVRKVKPLVRLSEREMAAYCVIRGIDYIVEECPMAEGNRHLAYKEALNTAGADVARRQGQLPLRLPRTGPRTLRRRRRGRAGRAHPLHGLRLAHPR